MFRNDFDPTVLKATTTKKKRKKLKMYINSKREFL